MQIHGLFIGQPTEQQYGTKMVLTAGHKRPVQEGELRATHFAGDQVADRKNHGSPDQAVCVYSFEHYAFWAETLGVAWGPGAFSENLTLAGATETAVCVGDIWQLGNARVQVTQPRQPCTKLSGKLARKDLPDRIHHTSFSGYYLRVLTPGRVRADDTATLEARHPLGVSIEFANQVMYKFRADRESLERVLAVEALSAAWRKNLQARLL